MGEETEVFKTSQFSLAFPHIMKRTPIDINEFLNWRLVCKQWRDTIDLFLENMNWFGDLRMNLAKLDKLSDITPELVSHPSNPFVGRRVFVYSFERPKEKEDEYWSKALDLFSKKGEHIHYITVCSDSSPLDFSQLLRAILSYLPNLKEVFLYYWNPDRAYLTTPQEQVYSELATYFESEPFPPLNSFQMFHFHTMDFPKPIQDALISAYGTQFRKLGVREWDQGYLPLLKNLDDFVLTINDNSELESLLKLKSPIETLMLLVNITEVDVALLFQVLEGFGETLSSLELYFLVEATFSSTPEILNLPKLNTLQIQNMRFLPLHFLKSLGGSLKQLVLQSEEIKPETTELEAAQGDEGGIQIRGFVGKMYESNVWQMLPKLQMLTVGNNELEVADENDVVKKVYTRQMYEYLRRFPQHTTG